MKTAREIVEGWHNGYELTDDSWIEMKANDIIEAVTAIQQDAFESGWKKGMEDSVDMRSKGVDPQRAIDAWKPTPQEK